MRDVPGIFDHLQAGIGQLLCQPDAIPGQRDAVIVSGDHQHRQGESLQVVGEPGRATGKGEFPQRAIQPFLGGFLDS